MTYKCPRVSSREYVRHVPEFQTCKGKIKLQDPEVIPLVMAAVYTRNSIRDDTCPQKFRTPGEDLPVSTWMHGCPLDKLVSQLQNGKLKSDIQSQKRSSDGDYTESSHALLRFFLSSCRSDIAPAACIGICRFRRQADVLFVNTPKSKSGLRRTRGRFFRN